MAIILRVAAAFMPISPSAEATNGEKYRLCWRHASRYIFFFLCLLKALLWCHCQIGLSVSVFDTHVMNTVCLIMSDIVDKKVAFLWHGIYLICWCCGCGIGRIWFFPLQGTTCVDEGIVAHVIWVMDFPAKSATLSQSLFWRVVTRPNFSQLRACHMKKVVLQPSQYVGMLCGSSTYCRKMASRHSCKASSVPFTVDGYTISHSRVFVSRCERCVTWKGSPYKVSTRASSSWRMLRFHTYYLPYCR